MKRLLLTAALLAAIPVIANAQTAACPTVSQNQTWTVQQWNTCLSSLAPLNNGTQTGTVLQTPTISSPTITGGTISQTAVDPSGGIGRIVVVATGSASITPSPVLDELIVVNKVTPAATAVELPAAVNWPNCPSTTSNACPTYTIKDGAGNAVTYPITITTADGKTIDGAASDVLSAAYGSVSLTYNGTQWNVVP
jgi:hypothetical protein